MTENSLPSLFQVLLATTAGFLIPSIIFGTIDSAVLLVIAQAIYYLTPLWFFLGELLMRDRKRMRQLSLLVAELEKPFSVRSTE